MRSCAHGSVKPMRLRTQSEKPEETKGKAYKRTAGGFSMPSSVQEGKITDEA